MIGVFVAGSSLTAIHTISADTTNPSHINDDKNNPYEDNNNNNNNNISPAHKRQSVTQNVGISTSNEGDNRRGGLGVGNISVSGVVGVSSNAGVSGEVDEFAMQQQQLQEQEQQAVPISAACGQVVSGVVNLTSNLNCSGGDGIIVGGPNTVINMNGFSITGPGQDSLKLELWYQMLIM